MFKRDPKQEARILNSVMESNFFPTKGKYFRIRSAAVADRSYMGCIWLCIDSQEHCAVGKKVLDTYLGLSGRGIGEIKAFVTGDVIFYDCTQIWDSVLRELEDNGRGTPPAAASGSEATAPTT